MARDILLKYRDEKNAVGIVKNLGSSDQRVIITNIRDLNIDDVDSLTTIIVGRDDTKEKNLKLTTPLY
jgi:cobalt-precorrin 5A hydrolase/precorrin-3B C17-methyltransferase